MSCEEWRIKWQPLQKLRRPSALQISLVIMRLPCTHVIAWVLYTYNQSNILNGKLNVVLGIRFKPKKPALYLAYTKQGSSQHCNQKAKINVSQLHQNGPWLE